jgi:hypothetical protein
MSSLKPRRDLKPDVKEEFQELFHKLILPPLQPLLEKVLKPQERRTLKGEKGGRNYVSLKHTLSVIASSRQLTLERAALELARAVDIIGIGKYERLRTAIGEPVTQSLHDVPQWDAKSLELRFRGKVIRRLSPRAKNCKRILSAFDTDGWPPRIESPLASGRNSSKLREAVRTLNGGLSAIRFYCDGTGEAVTWQEV